MMDRLFNLIPSNEHQTSCSQAQVMLQAYRERLLTGMVTISDQPQNKVVLFLVGGSLLNGYQSTADGWERVGEGCWTDGISRGDCRMRVRPLPPDGIRFAKTYLESTGTTQQSSIPSAAVPDLFHGWLTMPDMTIASLQWESAEGMIIFPGRSESPSPVLFASRDRITTGVEALEAILWHAETPCAATFRTGQMGTRAGQEYFLSLAFGTMVDRLLARYAELAGRSLPAMLAQEVNLAARVQGWQISILGMHVHDRGIFSSPEEASRAYRTILELCVRHISAVIGVPMTEEVLRRVSSQVGSVSSQLLQTYRVFPATGEDPCIEDA